MYNKHEKNSFLYLYFHNRVWSVIFFSPQCSRLKIAEATLLLLPLFWNNIHQQSKVWKFVMMCASSEIITFECQHFSSGWLYRLTVIWYGTLLSFLLGDLYSQAHLFCPSQYRMTRMVLAWPQLSPRAGTRRESSPGLNFVVIWLVKTIWKA